MLLCQLCFLWAFVCGRVRSADRRDRHWASFPLTSASTAPTGASLLALRYTPCHALFIYKVTFCSRLLHLGEVEDALGRYPSHHGVIHSAELKHCCPPSCRHGAVWAGPWSFTLFYVSASIAAWFSCCLPALPTINIKGTYHTFSSFYQGGRNGTSKYSAMLSTRLDPSCRAAVACWLECKNCSGEFSVWWASCNCRWREKQ